MDEFAAKPKERIMQKAHFILYVSDQEQSKRFYSSVLKRKATLDVAGMTEFELNDNCVLGLMPETGIKKLLGNVIPDPSAASGIPRAELYLLVDNLNEYHSRALENGGIELSKPCLRDWGDLVAYSLDLDGHVLAFAQKHPSK